MSNFIVTGGSAGIGLEIARHLATDGNDILIVGRSVDRLEDAQRILERDGLSGTSR